MGVAVPVSAQNHFGQGALQPVRYSLGRLESSGVLHQVEHASCVTVSQGGQQGQGLFGKFFAKVEAAALSDPNQLGLVQGAESKHVHPGEQLAGDTEGGVLRCRGQQGQVAAFQNGQKEILLCLGISVQLVKDQNVDFLNLLAQGRKPGLRRTEPHPPFSGLFRQQHGHGGFPAPGRAEQQQARQGTALHEHLQPVLEVRLPDEIVKGVGADFFGEGSGHGVFKG